MKFSKLSKEKKQHLVLVGIITLTVLGSLGYFLIKGGYDKLSSLNLKKHAAAEKLEQMQKTAKRAKEIEATFNATSEALTEQEAGMATGDLYSWMQSSLRKFQRGYKVEIPQISPIGQPEPVNLLPQFPYKQASLNIGGTAYYHDLGRFIADFENAFPLMRIVNLTLDLNPTPTAADRDKLAFKMDIITLIKPGKM
jgi:Tfp pilus assembly protein PilO